MVKPPENLDAEKSVVAYMLRNPTIAPALSDIVDAEDFANPANGVIYTALQRMSGQNDVDVTPITLIEYLRSEGDLNKVGGAPYITDLNKQPNYTKEQTIQHAEVIANVAKLRHSREALDQTYKELTGAETKDQHILLSAGQRILDIAQRTRTYRAVTPDQGLDDVLAQINESITRDGTLLGISTGFRSLDKIVYGFEPSKLYVLAARPGVGKTAFLLNIADQVAFNARIPVLFLSLEMSSDELYLRMFCGRAKVDSSVIKLGNAGQPTLQLVEEAAVKCKGAPMEVDDIPTRTIDEVRLRANRFVKALPSDATPLIIIDYLQLLSADVRRSESREREVAKVSVGLKAMAKELNVPVLSAAQLRRRQWTKTKGGELKPPPQPTLEDLRESGAIEQDADVVMLLHKMQDQNAEDGEQNGDQLYDDKAIKVIIAKNRAGRLGEIQMTFEAVYTRFREKYVNQDPGCNTFDNVFD